MLLSIVALLPLYLYSIVSASSLSGDRRSNCTSNEQPKDAENVKSLPITTFLHELQQLSLTDRAIKRSLYPIFGQSTLEDLLNKDHDTNNHQLENNLLSISESENNSSSGVLQYSQQQNDSSPFSMFAREENYNDTFDPELEKVELHTNNHQQTSPSNSYSSYSNLNNQNSRHYSTYQMSSGNQLHPSVGYFSKYGALHSNPKAHSNNFNLNYIHSLLNKPSSSSSLSNLLNFNSNLLPLTPSPFSLSLQNGYVSSYYSVPQLQTSNSIQQSIPEKQTQQQQSPQPPTQINQEQPILISNSLATNYIGSIPCGKQQVGVREPRIVGGNSTYEGEFPWAVSIQRQGNHHCGGVIVDRRWILTAAHCVRSQLVGNLIVRTGGHTLTRSSNHINSHLSRDYLVEQIVMHDDFSRYDNLTASQMKSSANTNNADIALLKLKNDIQWNELAWPVCFPSKDSGNFSGYDATVIGWGKLNEKSEDFSNELQKVKLTIIDNKVCQNWFRQAGRDMPIDERIICAGFKNGGKDACHGDSGGPLLSRINGQYVVVGVVSTGIGCARPLLPGLYSRVSSYISWIERYVTVV